MLAKAASGLLFVVEQELKRKELKVTYNCYISASSGDIVM